MDTPWKEKGSLSLGEVERGEEGGCPALEEDLGEHEQVLAAELKAKDPSAHLPNSTFLLAGFKHEYSHEDMLSVVLLYWGAL